MTTSDAKPGIRLWKVLLPLGICILLIVGALSLLKNQMSHPENGVSVQIGSVLPDIEIYPFQGKEKAVPLSSVQAKLMLVNFWASWCEACMVEMPSIVALRDEYKSRGLEVIAVNVDENPDKVVPPLLKSLGMDFQTYIDFEGKLSDLFDVHAIPLTVILNQDRKILLIESGERDWNSKEVHAKVEQWLKE